jgi:hypothetical protein
MFTHKGREWMVESAESGGQSNGRSHTRVRFVSKSTPRLEAFGHVPAPAHELDSVPDAELSRSLEAALADQSLG